MDIRKILIVLLAVVAPAMIRAVTPEEVDNVHGRDARRYVSDMAGVLSPQALARADSILGDIRRQTSAEAVMVIVDDLSGEDIDDWATELFSLWGIGKKDRDNGVLLVTSVNDRENVIRTGYGAEPVLPDVVCWNIIDKKMNPRFREGDFDAGVLDALQAVNASMTSEEARAELASSQPDGAAADDAGELFKGYLALGAICSLGLLLLVIYLWSTTGKLPVAEAYRKWDRWKLPAVMVTVLFIGIPLPWLIVMLLRMRHIRLQRHPCPNCGTRMHRLDEETDNEYLTPSQDLEEQLKSVDYDVWLCPKCNERDIIPYVNPLSSYKVCPACGTRAEQMVADRVVRQPSELHDGLAVRDFRCANCGHTRAVQTTLPKLPPVIIGGFGGHGGGGGGDFSGGSFGGGMTGGGGGRGGW